MEHCIGVLSVMARLCLVNREGNVEKSFAHEAKAAENKLNMPYCLAVGSSGCVIVTDPFKNRIEFDI